MLTWRLRRYAGWVSPTMLPTPVSSWVRKPPAGLRAPICWWTAACSPIVRINSAGTKTMIDIDQLIRHLRLEPLPVEGGYFRQTWASDELISIARYGSQRPAGNAIYYLLTSDA